MRGTRCRYVLLILVWAAFSTGAAGPAETSAPKPVKPEKTYTRAEVITIIGEARRIVSPNGVEELVEIPVGAHDGTAFSELNEWIRSTSS
jgi:hypothetical protein